MALKNIWKIILLSQGRCQYVRGRTDEGILEAVKKKKRKNGSGFREVGIRSEKKNNPKPENVSVSRKQ